MAHEVTFVVRMKNMMAAGLAGVKAALSGVAGAAQKIGSGIAKGLAGAAAGLTALFVAGSKLVGLYKVQAQAEAKRNAIMEASGFASGRTATELNKQASALQKLTGIGDETIISMQGVLGKFNLIRGDTFDRATVAAVDMGAAMRKAGADSAAIEEAAQGLGLALQDPAEGLQRLRRQGIIFSDSQKETIKRMVELGDVSGAQAIILTEIERKFGGTAVAMNKQSFGIDNIKASLGDMGESLGKAIVENAAFGDTITNVKDKIAELQESGKLQLFVNNFIDSFSVLRDGLSPIFDWLAKKIEALFSKLNQVGAGLGSFVHEVTKASSAEIEAKVTAEVMRGAIKDAAAAREAERYVKRMGMGPEVIERATKEREAAEKAEKFAMKRAALAEEQAIKDTSWGDRLSQASAAAKKAYDDYPAQAAADKKAALAAILKKNAEEEALRIAKERAEIAAKGDTRSTNEVARADRIASLKEKILALDGKILEKKEDQEKMTALQAKLAGHERDMAIERENAERAIADLKDLQAKTVGEFAAGEKEKKGREEEVGEEERLVERLEMKAGRRGFKAKKSEREFLEDVRAKRAAEDLAAKQAFEAGAREDAAWLDAKDAREAIRDAQDKQLQELQKLNRLLEQNLKAPGG